MELEEEKEKRMKKSEKTLRDIWEWESQKEDTEIKGQRDLT